MWKPYTAMTDRKINDMRIDDPNRDDSIVPIYMWESRAWKDQGMVASKALNIIRE